MSSFGYSGTVKLYDGAILASRHNVVVVVIQYRLGPFGFLPTSTLTNSTGGSNGLRDQISALQWVQWHIHRFGGDPDMITIFGESSGSVSVCTLLYSPLSKGMFHRAILQSGVCIPSIDLILTRDESRDAKNLYLKRLAGKNGSEGSAMDFLEKASAEEVIRRTFDAYDGNWVEIYLAGLGAPSVDGEVLVDLPVHLTPHIGVDVLAGLTSFDQTVSTLPNGREAFLSSFGINKDDARATIIEKSYPSPKDDSNLFLDACLRCQTHQVIQRTRKSGGTGHWYVFDCPHDLAEHGSDIAATFGNIDPEAVDLFGPPPPEDLVERMQGAWVAFARTGDPGWSDGALFGCNATTLMEESFGVACDIWTSAADAVGGLAVINACMSASYLGSSSEYTSNRMILEVAVGVALLVSCLVFSIGFTHLRRRRQYSFVADAPSNPDA